MSHKVMLAGALKPAILGGPKRVIRLLRAGFALNFS
jgi:hypothetical protein